MRNVVATGKDFICGSLCGFSQFLSSPFLFPDSRPTLHQLTKMTTPTGKTIEIIAADWHDRVGIHLNFDPTGRTLALIRACYPSDPEACCTDMMKEWLEGRGRWPVYWATLVRVLKEGEFSVLVEDVELVVTGGGSEKKGRKGERGVGREREGEREGERGRGE